MIYRICCLIVLFSTPVVAGENAHSAPSAELKRAPYHLSVDERGAGSDELLRGEYAAAIAAAQASVRIGQDLSAYLTLCAAYIRTDTLEKAVSACDNAVDLAKAPITTARNPYGHTNRDGLAKAHLDRGVLRSILGDLEAARTDFELALRQGRQPELVRHNMRLNASSLTAALDGRY